MLHRFYTSLDRIGLPERSGESEETRACPGLSEIGTGQEISGGLSRRLKKQPPEDSGMGARDGGEGEEGRVSVHTCIPGPSTLGLYLHALASHTLTHISVDAHQ